MAELQRVPVERHDQPAEEGPAEGIPLVPGRVQRTQRVQQAQTITSHPSQYFSPVSFLNFLVFKF